VTWGTERGGAPRRGRWSASEIARLKELYGLRDEKAIARELNRPVGSVRRMAEQIFQLATRTGPWTAREVQELKRYLGGTTPETIARILGRTPEEVLQQVEELRRVQHAGRWTPEEVIEFKRLYGTRTDEDLAVVFGRSIDAVKRLGARYCLAKDKAFVRRLTGSSATRMPRWADAEIEQLKQLYPHEANLDIAQKLNRSVKSVVSKAHNLGLKKEAERLKEMGRENVSMRYQKRGAQPAP
jgi:DNA-binding CsgD family transcriptional regulator